MSRNWKWFLFWSLFVFLLASGFVGSSHTRLGTGVDNLTVPASAVEESKFQSKTPVGLERRESLAADWMDHKSRPEDVVELIQPSISPKDNPERGSSFTTPGLLFCAPTPGFPIPDNDPTGTESNLGISTSGTLVDLDLYVDVPHTWVGDLVFTLKHQQTGTTVVAIDRPGVPASTFGCPGNNYDATIDDEATNPVENECGSGTPTIQGSFIGGDPPNASLMSAFDGEDLFGGWTLYVADLAEEDFGTLEEWCLVATIQSAISVYLPAVIKQ